MNLLRKLSLVVVGVGLPSLFAYTASALWFAQYGIRHSVSATQLEFGHQAMASIDRTLHERLDQLELLSTANMVERAVSSQTLASAERVSTTQRLKQVQANTAAWERIMVLRPNGSVQASTNDVEMGTTFAFEGAYRTAADQALAGKVGYSDVFIDTQTKQPTVAMAMPVMNDQQQVVGMVLGNLVWANVLTALQDNSTARIELFNSKGVELGDSDPSHHDEILRDDQRKSVVLQKAMGGKEGSEEVSSLHQKDELVLASYVQQKGFKEFKGKGWLLVVETPTSVAYAAVNNVMPTLIPTFIALAIAIYAIIISLIYRALIRPVKEVTEITNRIAEGDMTSRVKVRTKDEIGQLGAAFNLMTDKLQALYGGLEAKVQEKTAQLNARVLESETARARDEAILAGMGEGLLALNEKSEVVLANVRVAELFGIPRDKLFGKPLAEVLDGLRDSLDAILEPRFRPEIMAATSKTAVKEDYIYHRYLTDGASMNININATPIFNGSEVVGVVMVVRDITKEKEVDRMKTEFISLASHQLRTPLSAIKWFTQILMKGDAGPLNAEQTEFTKNIADSSERMIDLVNSLLNISRIESGRIIIDPHPTDLHELVTGVVHDLQAKIDEKRQQLTISVHQALPKINLDVHLISQVYMNLLTNAIKYTPMEGKISVMVSHKDGEIISQVSDTGFGIPIGQQEKVFDKFFRADNVAKIETDGTGLGLYLVKAIVESSGGKIWFASEENKGTTFWFSLPATGMQAQDGEVVLNE